MDANEYTGRTHVKHVYLTVAAFFALWILWVLVLIAFPALNRPEPLPSLLHAGVRIVLWLGPIALYARVVERTSLVALFGFGVELRRGILGAGLLVGVAAMLAAGRYLLLGHGATDPRAYSLGTWINPLLLAPIVEELLFRSFLYRKTESVHGPWAALVISSALFALIHFPYWFLSGNLTGWPLAMQLGIIFLLGAVFALAQRIFRNVVAPIGGHLANNFFSGLVP
jgi:membrane protease YdiL (CAAX protease family)